MKYVRYKVIGNRKIRWLDVHTHILYTKFLINGSDNQEVSKGKLLEVYQVGGKRDK